MSTPPIEKTNKPLIDIDHLIVQVERRIEVRRRRMSRHVEELQEVARSRARPVALIGAVGAVIGGIARCDRGAASQCAGTGTRSHRQSVAPESPRSFWASSSWC